MFCVSIVLSNIQFNLINSGLLIQLELILIRQLDIFDGAGSGDGINGRTRTSSEQMLVIFLKPLFYICVIVILLFLKPARTLHASEHHLL